MAGSADVSGNISLGDNGTTSSFEMSGAPISLSCAIDRQRYERFVLCSWNTPLNSTTRPENYGGGFAMGPFVAGLEWKESLCLRETVSHVDTFVSVLASSLPPKINPA